MVPKQKNSASLAISSAVRAALRDLDHGTDLILQIECLLAAISFIGGLDNNVLYVLKLLDVSPTSGIMISGTIFHSAMALS